MNLNIRRLVQASTIVTCVTIAACEVPLLPEWDTRWNVPLPSTAMAVPPVPIPNNTTIADSIPTQQQSLDASIGTLLDNAADTGSVVIEVRKRQALALSGADTVLIAASAANLNNPGSRITVPFSFAASDSMRAETVSVNLGIVRTIAANDGTLFLKVQGRVSNTSGGTVTPQASDSIRLRLALLALIHSSK